VPSGLAVVDVSEVYFVEHYDIQSDRLMRDKRKVSFFTAFNSFVYWDLFFLLNLTLHDR